MGYDQREFGETGSLYAHFSSKGNKQGSTYQKDGK